MTDYPSAEAVDAAYLADDGNIDDALRAAYAIDLPRICAQVEAEVRDRIAGEIKTEWDRSLARGNYRSALYLAEQIARGDRA